MNYRMNLYVMSQFLVTIAILLLVPFFMAIGLKEQGTILAFGVTIAAFAVISVPSLIKKPKNTKLFARDGFFIVAIGWIVISILGCLPFVISRYIPSFTDAFFETVSGLTTTGSTILFDIESLPKSLLFWRSFTQWIGGMGILVFFLAVIPKSAKFSIHIFRAESSMSQNIQLMTRVRHSARVLYAIYIGLTVIETVLLLFSGMSFFEALLTAFTNAGTGGFSPRNASIAAYNNVYVEVVITVFMLLYSLNFNIYFLILLGKFKQVIKNEELLWFLGIVIVSITAITVSLSVTHTYNTVAEALRYSSFTVASTISTTGFVICNYTATWPMLSQYILFFLMFVGGCAGSTAGGLKVTRIVILAKAGSRELVKSLNPRLVKCVRMDGKAVDEGLVSSVFGYMANFLIIFIISMFMIVLAGEVDFGTGISLVTTAINNVGPAFGDSIGATGSFGGLNPLAKWVLSFDMLVGRLELLPMILLFYPRTWKC